MSRSSSKAQREVAQHRIRASGLRATPARVAVLALLGQEQGPRSHGEVADGLADGGWDRATIYRNLMDLTRAGLVRRTRFGNRVYRFELAGGAEHEHPHFVCRECGSVACLPEAEIAVQKAQDIPRAVACRDVEVQLRGRCDTCLPGEHAEGDGSGIRADR